MDASQACSDVPQGLSQFLFIAANNVPCSTEAILKSNMLTTIKLVRASLSELFSKYDILRLPGFSDRC